MTIETPRLTLRNWQEEERAVFHRLNADKHVMAFFPWRKSREESGHFFDSTRNSLESTGFGFYALEEKRTHAVIGLAGLLQTDLEPFIPKNTVEIGWRLLPEHWGRGFATEAARTLLAHAFNTMKLEEIVSLAVEDNLRSIAVMQRIGMTAEPEQGFDHPRVPDSTPHLKRHVLFRIKRQPEKIL